MSAPGAAIVEGPLWLIGCGNMAGAMLRRWLQAGLDPAQVTVIDPGTPALSDGVLVLATPPIDGEVPATVLLGVKPQLLDQVAPTIAPILAPETLLLSILAGVETGALRKRFFDVESDRPRHAEHAGRDRQGGARASRRRGQ